MQKKVPLQESTVLTPPTIVSDIKRLSEVARYTQWLSAENSRCNAVGLQDERRNYTKDAERVIQVQGKDLRPFSPFGKHSLHTKR